MEQRRHPRAGAPALQGRGPRLQEGDRDQARVATPWKNLGHAYLALGREQEAFEAYQEAFRLDATILEQQSTGIPAAGIDAAAQYVLLAKLLAAKGQIEPALDFLERAKAAGFRDFRRVEQDPDFKDVVATARYRALVGAK
ncbi:MAG: tetratricopeptide repeat protein [Vicinamibacteria bacterium]